MFPKANIPVVEVAMPFTFREAELAVLGRTLAPLRNERILILASGTLTHNLAAADLQGNSAVPAWASDFDGWVKKTLEARDATPFANWRKFAPAADIAHPDDGGHFRALLFAVGAAMTKDATFASVRFPIEGFELGNLSKRCVELT
jgi:4,5-DOPA dioxygenase extradiol